MSITGDVDHNITMVQSTYPSNEQQNELEGRLHRLSNYQINVLNKFPQILSNATEEMAKSCSSTARMHSCDQTETNKMF